MKSSKPAGTKEKELGVGLGKEVLLPWHSQLLLLPSLVQLWQSEPWAGSCAGSTQGVQPGPCQALKGFVVVAFNIK